MASVPVSAPNLKEVEPRALAVANYLRHHKVLKQRQGILNHKRQDFFRGGSTADGMDSFFSVKVLTNVLFFCVC